MKIRVFISLLSLLAVLGWGLLSLAIYAQPSQEASQKTSKIPLPELPKANKSFSSDQACVEPIDIIRRNHGDFLKHHRNKTMHQGIRTKQHSLVQCINCHVTSDEPGNYPSIHEGKEHFCRSCHVYAAVSIDCFQCHSSQPELMVNGEL
jgi:hypothetical protein